MSESEINMRIMKINISYNDYRDAFNFTAVIAIASLFAALWFGTPVVLDGNFAQNGIGFVTATLMLTTSTAICVFCGVQLHRLEKAGYGPQTAPIN
jgi:hypothetical protein